MYVRPGVRSIFGYGAVAPQTRRQRIHSLEQGDEEGRDGPPTDDGANALPASGIRRPPLFPLRPVSHSPIRFPTSCAIYRVTRMVAE